MNIDIGKKIHELRKNKNMTQEQLTASCKRYKIILNKLRV